VEERVVMAQDHGKRIIRPFEVGMTRRALLRRAAILGAAGTMGGGLLAACGNGDQAAPGNGNGNGNGSGRPLTPSYYDWILSLFPPIQAVSADFEHEVNVQQAPTEGFGIERFVAEAREGESTWDIYVGQTPFVEMASLITAEVTEPWDDYLSQDILDAMIPSVRDEGTFDGALYNFPFLVDIIVSAWNSELVEAAGLDPQDPPETWDDLIERAQEVANSGAAPYGVTFDAHGWRSLAPIAHSFSTEVYREDGLFDFTHDAVVDALEVMRRMMELANPNVLDPGTTDGGVNDTPDEGVFAAGQVGYYVKYQNAPVRLAGGWADPEGLVMAGLPTGGADATVFWSTGAAIFRHGHNKEIAGDYMHHMVTDERIWEQSLGEGERVGQLPPMQSTWDEWESDRPDWLVDWADFLGEQLEAARAIETTAFGVQQFNIGKPHWETYLTGEESDPRAALQAAMDAVDQEVEREGT
jgi:multiple sugar transport system substrate-binding protein